MCVASKGKSDHLAATVARTKYGVQMVSPKLNKANVDGDSEELDEDQTSSFKSSVLTLQRTDVQSSVRHLCTKLKCPTAL